MALLTSNRISSLAVQLLTRTLVLPNTVARIPGAEFSGDNGDTVTVRVPQPGTARTQASPGATITYDTISETPVDVSMTHKYHAKRVTDEELTFDIVDFGAQVTAIQVDAVARGAEDLLAAAMNGVAADASFALTASDADTETQLLAARQALGEANVPAGDRFLAVSPDIATRLLGLDSLRDASQSGSSGALREAEIGRLYGFTIVESNALTAGTAIAYHRTGFVFANRPPATPRGANDSAVASMGGISLRHIFQYQPDILSDASVVSTFAGAAVVDANRVYKMDTATA